MTARRSDRGSVSVELGLCCVKSEFEVIVVELRVNDFVASIFQKRWFHAANDAIPTVEKETFHDGDASVDSNKIVDELCNIEIDWWVQ